MTEISFQVPPYQGALLGILRQLVDEIWQVEKLCNLAERPRSYPLYSMFGPLAGVEGKAQGESWLGETLARLLDATNSDVVELNREAALLYFRPGGWIQPYTFDYSRPEAESYAAMARGEIMQLVLAEWIRLHSSTITRSLLVERIETLMRGPSAKWKPDLYRPSLADCIKLLVGDQSNEANEVLLQLVTGSHGRPRKGSVEEPELRQAAPAILLRLWKSRRFSYNDFREAMYLVPGVFQELTFPPEQQKTFNRDMPMAFILEMQNFTLKLTGELAERLPSGDPKAAALLKEAGYLEGASWLFLACSAVEARGLEQLPEISSEEPAAAITRLCQAKHPLVTTEDDAQTVEFLSHYRLETLQAVLPHVTDYRPLVEKALERHA